MKLTFFSPGAITDSAKVILRTQKRFLSFTHDGMDEADLVVFYLSVEVFEDGFHGAFEANGFPGLAQFGGFF